MKYRNHTLQITFLFFFSFIFFGCNKYDEELTNKEIRNITVIDDIVIGLRYINEGNTGFTDEKGQFKYSSGKVSLYLGKIKLGEIKKIPNDDKIFIQDLVGVQRENTSNKNVLNIVKLLHSIDYDKTTDKIEIPRTLYEKFDNIEADISYLDVETLLYSKQIAIIENNNVKRVLKNVLKSHKIITDNEDLNLSSSFPKNNSENIELKSEIILNFNDDVTKDSFKNSKIIFKDNNGIEIDSKIILNFDRITIRPIKKLSYDTKYSIIIPATLKDYGKNSLKKEIVINFTTKKDIKVKIKKENKEKDTKVNTTPKINISPKIENNSLNIEVAENQTKVIKIQAKDEDKDTLVYSLSGEDVNEFNINSLSGEITFKVAPDYEIKKLYKVTVNVSDGKNIVSKELIINIKNQFDVKPKLKDKYSFKILENLSSNTKVGKIEVLDTGDSQITQFIIDDNTNFKINNNGELYTLKSFNFEDKNKYKINLKVKNQAGNSQEETVTIDIENENEIPKIENNSLNIEVAENQTKVIKIQAKDEDEDTLVYSLGGEDENEFNINSSNGEITFKVAPDYEIKKLYKVTVNVSDGKNIVSKNLIVNILKNLYIISAMYDDNRTSNVDDDLLYIYFDKEIKEDSLSNEIASNFDIQGNGKIGTGSSKTYDSVLKRVKIKLSSGSLSFKNSDTISLNKDIVIKRPDSSNLISSDTQIKIQLHNIFNKLKTGQIYCYDNSGVKTDCQNTKGQDGNYQLTIQRKYLRDDTLEIIKDTSTSLQWQDNSDVISFDKTWSEAKYYCQNSSFAGYDNWRLPNIEELLTIVDYSVAYIYINKNYFHNRAKANYWTSSTSSSTNPWYVDFTQGKSTFDTISKAKVRCVR